jgi:exportin-2 (importin alpha re-exporter)
VLEKSGSAVKADRQAAEAQLRQMQQAPGFGVIALQFLTLDNVSPALKQASAVTFKNLVKANWTMLSDQDRTQIKTNILPLLLSGRLPALRSLLGDAVTLVAQHDFPALWPNLVSDLVARANPQDYVTLVGVLRTAHAVFRRYRNVSMSTEVLRELKLILEQFQRPLTAIVVSTWQQLSQNPDPTRAPLLLEAANLSAKLFYDLNYVDLPEFFEDHLKDWMTGFMQAVRFKTNNPKLLGDEDRPGVVHKLQKNVCMVLTLYATKYDEEFGPFLDQFVESVWQLLNESLTANLSKHDAIVSHGVAFLTAVANGANHKLFGNGTIMKSICEKIVIPCMMLRKEDVELFDDEPNEYVRQDIEGSDLDTRRRSAKELVKGLRKNYEREVTEIFGSYIQVLLGQYKANPKGGWKSKDVAVFLLTAVAVSTFRQATGASTVNPMVPLIPFYQEQVLPDLLAAPGSVHKVLQADALKFVITFRSQIPASEYARLLPAIVGQLKSPIWVVHTYAANALENLLTIKDPNPAGGPSTQRISKDNLEPVLKELLGALFGVLQNTGQKPNAYVMKAIMRVISRAQEKLRPLLPTVLENLSGLLRTVIANQQSPVFNHYLFESLGGLIGCAAAAGGSQGVASLETQMLPMFQSILQQDIQEFTGYVFQLLAQLLAAHTEGVPDVFWGLFPSLLSPTLWDKPGNVPALVRLLGEYVAKGAARLAANEQWMGSYLGVWQHLNSATKHDGESFGLLVSLTDHMPLPVLDKFLPRILGFVFARLSNPKGKTPRYVKGFVTWLLQCAAKHGGGAIMARCNAVQANIWISCLGLIGQSINKPRSLGDKKRCALGAVKLLTSTDEMLTEPHAALWGPLLLALMGLFELPEEEEDAEGGGAIDAEEISGGAVFTPLFHAGMLADKDAYPGVNDRAELAKGLAALNQKTGKVPAMISGSLPPEAQKKLQTYFQAANVRM